MSDPRFSKQAAEARAQLRAASVEVQRDAPDHPLMRRRMKALRRAWKRGRLMSVAQAVNGAAGTAARLRAGAAA